MKKKWKIVSIILSITLLAVLAIAIFYPNASEKPTPLNEIGPKTISLSSCESWGGTMREAQSINGKLDLNNTCRSNENNIGPVQDLKCPCYCCMPIK